MNVLVLSHLYPRPHDRSFGIFVHRQVKSLQGIGLHVTVLSPEPWAPRILGFSAKWRAYASTPPQAIWEDVPVYYTRYLRLPGAWFRALGGITAYQGMVSLAAELHKTSPFDVIHSNWLLPDGLAGVYLGRKLNLPTVCTMRGNDALTQPYENPLNLCFSKTAMRQTGQIVTVSRALKQAAENLAKPDRIIRVVYNGVDLEKFQEPAAGIAEQARLEVSCGKPYILFIGRDVRRKGLKDLLTAFAQLVGELEHNLVVVGPTPSEVEELAAERGELLAGRLIVPGCLAPAEVPAYMQGCEMLVLPSYEEGLPNVVLEAMACGKPVIGTDVMGIPEAVIHGVTGWIVRPGDPPGLAESIQLLVNDPGRCREMGRRGRERIVQEFTWERHAQEMLSAYVEVVSQ
jgi:teichuronic acid biosynthesis glycosyltransferase TuaC